MKDNGQPYNQEENKKAEQNGQKQPPAVYYFLF